MGNCCSSPINDATNSWSADANIGGLIKIQQEEQKVIRADNSSTDEGRRFKDRDKYSSSDDEEEAK